MPLAGNKRRSFSSQGGLLNRMFGGSSPPKEKADLVPHSGATGPNSPPSIAEEPSAATGDKKSSSSPSPFTKKANTEPVQGADKKRRSSSVTRAASFFTSAKNSFLSSSPRESSGGLPAPSTPMQKLGKMDPALSVPQGSLNNSAGESLPTTRSSFRVGVTEDRNRKCRRTMEDTHAYLYNFLGTPAPTFPVSESPSSNSKGSPDDSSAVSDVSTHVVETDNGYFAIFDGHAGTFAAEWCGKKLHLILEEIMRKHPNTAVPELLDQAFTCVDQQLEKLPLKNSGCTAVAAVLRWEDRVPSTQPLAGSATLAPVASTGSVPSVKLESAGENENPSSADTPTQTTQPSNSTTTPPKPPETPTRQRMLYTANVGDARVILCRNGKALRLSYDHKGSDDNEGKRIASAGGLILNNRVNGVLAVTRALGDAYLKDLVTGHPYTTETVIQPEADEFMILACDGLWDVCSDQEAVDLIRNTHDPQAASKILVDHALSRFSTDNLSCMIVRFDTKLVQDMVEHRIDPIGVEGDVPTNPTDVSEADKIIEDAKKNVEGLGLVDGDKNPLDSEKVQEDIAREAEKQEAGPEASPAEENVASKVAGLDVQTKPNIEENGKRIKPEE
ncbi:Protein phosphatase 2C 1 [Arachnomyces sp. PD_36]|nr:Protein phosphatase 2C 1 [Arachnomyces sp. PD_36]